MFYKKKGMQMQLIINTESIQLNVDASIVQEVLSQKFGEDKIIKDCFIKDEAESKSSVSEEVMKIIVQEVLKRVKVIVN